MKEIPLSQGMVALIDDDDFEVIGKLRWHVAKQGTLYYAHTSGLRKLGFDVYRMQWLVIGKPVNGFVVDHEDGNGLNNQSSNLRFLYSRQNTQNKHKKYSSRYPGVSWHKHTCKWIAHIKIDQKVKHLGSFSTEQEAFESYKHAVAICGQSVVIPNKGRW